MAYETGTASSLNDLLQTLVTFAASNAGFTEITKVTGIANSNSDMYILQKGSIYWYFIGFERTLTNYGTYGYIDCRMMTVEPTAANRNTLSLGQPINTWVGLFNRPSGPYTTYYLFTDVTAVHMAVEVTPGIYTHLSFGSVDKFGTWTGGEYLSGEHSARSNYSPTTGFENYNTSISSGRSSLIMQGNYDSITSLSDSARPTFIYNPVNSRGDNRDFTPVNISIDSDFDNQAAAFTGSPDNYSGTGSILNNLLINSPNAFNQRSALLPTYLRLWDPNSSRWILAGDVPSVKIVNTQLIDPAEVVEVTWQVFPNVQKAGDQMIAPVTGNAGVAYQRVS